MRRVGMTRLVAPGLMIGMLAVAGIGGAVSLSRLSQLHELNRAALTHGQLATSVDRLRVGMQEGVALLTDAAGFLEDPAQYGLTHSDDPHGHHHEDGLEAAHPLRHALADFRAGQAAARALKSWSAPMNLASAAMIDASEAALAQLDRDEVPDQARREALILASGTLSAEVAERALELGQEAEGHSRALMRILLATLAVMLIYAGAAMRWLMLPMLKRESDRVRALEQRIDQAARDSVRDALTGMPNALGLRRAIAEAYDTQDSRPALIRMSLDHGRMARGGLPLERVRALDRAAARRLRTHLVAGEIAARLGAGEFALLLRGTHSFSSALAVCQRLTRGLGGARAEPGSDPVSLHLRIGVAVAEPGRGVTDLLADAEAALDESMAPDAPGLVPCTPALRSRLAERARLADELPAALTGGEVIPFFQPQVSLETGELVGFETLARWRHPRRGLLSPGEFLPVAEAAGRMQALADAVAGGALTALADWRARKLPAGRIAINVSARELRDPVLVEKLRWDVDSAGLTPEDIAIEVLETMLVEHDDDPAVRTVAALAAAGFSVELDDFGTGHAALANLLKFKVHRLKIDRSLIRGIDMDGDRRKILRSMVALAESLGVEVLAEGVETAAEAAVAADAGCEAAQGFLIARPMPRELAERWITSWQPAEFMNSLHVASETATQRDVLIWTNDPPPLREIGIG